MMIILYFQCRVCLHGTYVISAVVMLQLCRDGRFGEIKRGERKIEEKREGKERG